MNADELVTQRFLEQEKEIERLKNANEALKKERDEMLDIVTCVARLGIIEEMPIPPMNPLGPKRFGFFITCNTLEDEEAISKFMYYLKRRYG